MHNVTNTFTVRYERKADSTLAPNQWETSLQSNAAVSHWQGANLESAALECGGWAKIPSIQLVT